MKQLELRLAATRIVSNNLTNQVTRVAINWDETVAKLVVCYFVDGTATDEDLELCELTLAELLAEFPDIQIADTKCLSYSNGHRTTGEWAVYERAGTVAG